ncbi:Interleukin-1 receptor-associated kinase 3 [Bagarius yarrelli]|uniref:Interleukin-1 receptor-associated kinase 3 n=1 Tax=Bagarius yarrelli TaxID=175774 RepID=A0A556THF4_BAGYA|nr:Interleukin-1 receptor-associated kinase 3 [Bagarius yarrelli]
MAHLRPHTVNQSCTITMDTGPLSNLAYLPEEYIRDGKLSVKLDIYSLGMRDVLSLEVEEKGSVDACLCFLDSSAGEWPTAVAMCLLRLGLECTSSRARARPSMDNVLEKLNEIQPLPFALDECPQTLVDMTPSSIPLTDGLSSGMPGRNDRPQLPEQSEPQECSQSEVIFVGKNKHGMCLERENAAEQCLQTECTSALDLYSSWPVECSCAAGVETGCEDCWANGFSHNPSFVPQGM